MLGERLAAARKRAGLAQVDLAAVLGKDRSLVSHVESNRAGLLVDGLAKVARTLGVSTDYLLSLTDDPMPASERESPTPVLGQRLAAARKRAGIAQVELAVAMGDRYDQTVVSAIENNRSSVRVDGLVNAAKELGVSTDYLMGLTDDPSSAATRESESASGVRYIEVRQLAAAAGGGASVWDETVTGHLAFARDWLERHAIDPAQCTVIGVRGESMEPTLPDGCAILVDRSQRQPQDGHIYVLRTDEGLVVKRLGRGQDGRWQLRSEHADWPPVPMLHTAAVIGAVRWMARTL